MDHEQDGREPTDAELLRDFEAADVRMNNSCETCMDFNEDGEPTDSEYIAAQDEWTHAHARREIRGKEYLSGQRPMPDTPAPDEVAQLPEWAGVYTASDIESLLRDTERVLKYLRWDGKMSEKHEVRMIGKAVEEGEFTVARKLVREMIEDRERLTARVAVLEKRLSVIHNWALVEEDEMGLFAQGYGAARRWVAMWFKNDAAPGKEPTSE